MNRTRGSLYGLEMFQSTNSQKPHSLTLLTSLKRLVQSKWFWYKWEITPKKVTKFNNFNDFSIEQFQKLFKVLDAHRVSKRGMQEMMGDNKLEEHVEKYALYRIDLDWAMSSFLKLYESPIWMTLWRKRAKHTVRCTKLTRISRERSRGLTVVVDSWGAWLQLVYSLVVALPLRIGKRVSLFLYLESDTLPIALTILSTTTFLRSFSSLLYVLLGNFTLISITIKFKLLIIS